MADVYSDEDVCAHGRHVEACGACAATRAAQAAQEKAARAAHRAQYERKTVLRKRAV